ncbi:NAD-dependent epimerase/dehydratase family protein [Budviciaceae bacterium BWR-B9]|uniref:NAD-dependent epimerase/dehydratase family protein n=1 Tax=Limnobaculum allomyrinae TaxID=2791986 RepID=A0ABS1ITF6_9GAMM|nr:MULTISPECIES: NAD-dependent epimerase/dehydratase family protein [Limnobaculum]MBK5145048.1 NAD-dependent epimerase/dehydratase family protein [Limnobaculum allomyrinae]MBV7692879.1 NAD-dependent epimerase/dehydratase family protein [Limnobaculum sp. M2-1]
MKILVTGSEGFIGRNLCLRLEEVGYNDLIKIDRTATEDELLSAVKAADFIFHLAGTNRPKDDNEFQIGNSELTQKIIDTLVESNLTTPFMLSSSTQAEYDNPYGKSKAAAEIALNNYVQKMGAKAFIYRFPNVFGKWCRPNYNSFVATFCYNIASDIEISIHDPAAAVTLVYIDDVCSELISLLQNTSLSGYRTVSPEYKTTVGEVAELLYKFKESRRTLITEAVGTDFCRALYSTWLSYLSPTQFSYSVPSYSDQRGVFCEMLKTQDSGQFSFFSAHPGITRGGHYHHSKNEKFLVIQGSACFRFEHVITGEQYSLDTSSDSYTIVESVPGWTHDITNTGENELIVMLWANEIFDKSVPDTIPRAL